MEDQGFHRKTIIFIGIILIISIISVSIYLIVNAVNNSKPKEPVYEDPATLEKFSKGDLYINGLTINMTIDEVKAIIGEPVSIFDLKKYCSQPDQDYYTEEKTCTSKQYYIDYNYSGLSIRFYQIANVYKLTEITVSSNVWLGVRNIRVGEDENKVIHSFYKDPNLNSDYIDTDVEGKYLYGNAKISTLSILQTKDIIEYAYVTEKNYVTNYYQISYFYIEPPYLTEYASSKDDYYNLIFEMQNGKVKSITIKYVLPS